MLYTRRISVCSQLASRWWWTRSRISEQMRICGMRMNMSSVSAMRPSVEFSSGTTPKSACLRFTSSNTAAIDPVRMYSTDSPNRSRAARWL